MHFECGQGDVASDKPTGQIGELHLDPRSIKVGAGGGRTLSGETDLPIHLGQRQTSETFADRLFLFRVDVAVLTVVETYDEAGVSGGHRDGALVLLQVLPNIMPIMVVQMSLTMGYAILNAAGLSFIGLGVRPPMAEWGIMVAEGAGFIVSGEWWIALFPGATLMLAVFCFNLLGDGLRDIADPRRRT